MRPTQGSSLRREPMVSSTSPIQRKLPENEDGGNYDKLGRTPRIVASFFLSILIHK